MVDVILAWMFADFTAGLFHFLEDRYIRDEWPILGKYVGAPNSLHHSKPSAFLDGGYWHRNWTTIGPSLVLFVLAIWAGLPTWVWMGCLFLSQANEVHSYSHKRGKLPAIVETLQEIGIFQSPNHHGHHHKSPHLVRFCVMSNWLNPILDRLGFWRSIEFCLSLLGATTKDTGSG